MKRLLPLLLIAGCGHSHRPEPIPRGEGAITVRVPGGAGAVAHLRTESERSATVEARVGPDGRVTFDGLGDAVYRLWLTDLPRTDVPMPGRHRIDLRGESHHTAGFELRPGASLSRSEERRGFRRLLVIPESKLAAHPREAGWWASLRAHDFDLYERGTTLPILATDEPVWLVFGLGLVARWFELPELPAGWGVAEGLEMVFRLLTAETKDVERLLHELLRILSRENPPLWGGWEEPVWLERLEKVAAGTSIAIDPRIDRTAMELPNRVVLDGRVVDSSGAPVRARMLLHLAEGGLGALVETNRDGAFEVRGLPAGSYRARVFAWGGAGEIERNLTIDLPAARETRELRLP